MPGKVKKENMTIFKLYKICLVIILPFLFLAAANGQMTDTAQNAATETAKETAVVNVVSPVFTDYKEIKIGTTADQVRERLGKAVIDDKDGFYYQISDVEAVQIRLDGDKKVRFISIDYSGKAEKQPKLENVFGSEAKAEAKPNGSIYKLVRYREAGYWVAYSRTAGEKPIVTVTIQKM